jgi:small subunit ribosomal protein S20
VNTENTRLSPSGAAEKQHGTSPARIFRLANIKSAAKRAKQSERRRQHNIALKSRMRSAVKKVINAIQKGDAEVAATDYRDAAPQIDKMANKGLIHRNKAARHKSRLNKAVKALSAG